MRLDGHVEQIRADGFAILRQVFDPADIAEMAAETDRIYDEAVAHEASWRHGNLYYEVIDDPAAGRIVLQAHWISWVSAAFERLRRDERVFDVLAPLLGGDIKQLANQIHWKPPAASFGAFRFHQDFRFRQPAGAFRDLATACVTMGVAIDRHGPANGGLRIVPGSHRQGDLALSPEGPLMKGATGPDELHAAGLDPDSVVDVELEPGDMVLWTQYTAHGSGPNRSAGDRRFLINSYIRADKSDRGEWAFRGGESVALGAEPSLVRYEDLYTRPEPHYIADDWYRD